MRVARGSASWLSSHGRGLGKNWRLLHTRLFFFHPRQSCFHQCTRFPHADLGVGDKGPSSEQRMLAQGWGGGGAPWGAVKGSGWRRSWAAVLRPCPDTQPSAFTPELTCRGWGLPGLCSREPVWQRRGQSCTSSFWLPPESEQTGSPGGCPTYAGWNTPPLQCPGQLSSSSSSVCDQKLTSVGGEYLEGRPGLISDIRQLFSQVPSDFL